MPQLSKFLVNLVPAQKQQLERIARRDSRSMSAIVRIALTEYLERNGEAAKVIPIIPGQRTLPSEAPKAA